MTTMSPCEVKRLQSLPVEMFEESAKDLIRNCADWAHTVSDMVLVVAHDMTVWLCDPRDDVSLRNAKMIKRVL